MHIPIQLPMALSQRPVKCVWPSTLSSYWLSPRWVCRDKMDVASQEIDVVMGLVTINPRYSPKLIRDKSFAKPADAFRTLVRVALLPCPSAFPASLFRAHWRSIASSISWHAFKCRAGVRCRSMCSRPVDHALVVGGNTRLSWKHSM